MKRTLKRGLKVLEIVKREAIGTSIRPSGNQRPSEMDPRGARSSSLRAGLGAPGLGKTGPFRARALPRAGGSTWVWLR